MGRVGAGTVVAADKSSCTSQLPPSPTHVKFLNIVNNLASVKFTASMSDRDIFFNDGASVAVWVERPQIPATQRRIHSKAHVALECCMTYIWRGLGKKKKKSFRFLNNEVPATV